MPDEAREVKPFQMLDKNYNSKLDFRPQPIVEEEEQAPDPKDLSAPAPVVSSATQLTIDGVLEPTASAAKGSTSRKANGIGKQTSSEVTSIGKTERPVVI